MAIGREMKRTFRGNKKTDNEWSNHSKSMRSAGGTSNTREVRSAIKNTAKSFATPMRTPSVARSGYAKKLKTQELRGKSQISYKKPNTTTLPTPTMTSSISRAVEKRDYATPETSFARTTRNKALAHRKNVSKYSRYR